MEGALVDAHEVAIQLAVAPEARSRAVKTKPREHAKKRLPLEKLAEIELRALGERVGSRVEGLLPARGEQLIYLAAVLG